MRWVGGLEESDRYPRQPTAGRLSCSTGLVVPPNPPPHHTHSTHSSLSPVLSQHPLPSAPIGSTSGLTPAPHERRSSIPSPPHSRGPLRPILPSRRAFPPLQCVRHGGPSNPAPEAQQSHPAPAPERRFPAAQTQMGRRRPRFLVPWRPHTRQHEASEPRGRGQLSHHGTALRPGTTRTGKAEKKVRCGKPQLRAGAERSVAATRGATAGWGAVWGAHGQTARLHPLDAHGRGGRLDPATLRLHHRVHDTAGSLQVSHGPAIARPRPVVLHPDGLPHLSSLLPGLRGRGVPHDARGASLVGLWHCRGQVLPERHRHAPRDAFEDLVGQDGGHCLCAGVGLAAGLRGPHCPLRRHCGLPFFRRQGPRIGPPLFL